VMVTRLMPGQCATVLQLPASAHDRTRPAEGAAQRERTIEPAAQ
jgi:hypothetical protein